MPEASIHEHGQVHAREHDVRPTADTGDRGMIDTEAQPTSVKLTSELKLRACVPSAVRAHGRARSRRRRGGGCLAPGDPQSMTSTAAGGVRLWAYRAHAA
jgi:hypothetical protein